MKILVLSFGSAESPNSWSGVPYHTVSKLRSLGAICDCIDIGNIFGICLLRRVYNYIYRMVHPAALHTFSNTRIGLLLMNYWLRFKIRHNRQYDAVLAFSYSIDGKGIGMPLILIHDWTNEYQIVEFWNSRPSKHEMRQAKNAYRTMSNASVAISLYPAAVEFMNARMPVGKHIRFICNPVNTEAALSFVDIENARVSSRRILLVGGEFYRENVEKVIEAVNILGDDRIEVDVVGLKFINTKTKNRVRCYGYLSKEKSDELKKYRELMLSARVFINIRTGWGGGSSVAEAMYNYLPVIVGRYPDIEALYGHELPFGFYSKPGDVAECSRHIREIMEMDASRYVDLCKSAHKLTEQHTYANFASELLNIVSEFRMK